MAAATTLAWVGLAVAAGSAVVSYSQQRRAQAAQERAADDQRRGNAVQSAQQSQQAAQERRQQIREERIKRASILNSAENSGASGSSGEMGATGGMSTQLGSNLGANGSSILAGQAITGFSQSAANNMQAAQTAQGRASMWGQVGQIGSSMFGQAGGWQTIFGNPPKTR